MSRTRRAGISAGFGYLQFGLAFASGIAVVPLVLSRVGSEAYGLWLGFGELLAYSAMVDLGVLGVLPWLLAESDGRGDREEMRRLLAGGVALSLMAAALFALLALGLFWLAPGLTRVTAAQREAVLGPVLLVVAGTALAYPLRTFYAALIGLQDVVFTGIAGVAQLALNLALVVGLLLGGFGLYALAAAAVLPPLAVVTASWLRLRARAPDLLGGWRLPPRALLRTMTAQGMGSWTAGIGWRMVAASNSIVLLSVAGPEAAVVYAVTAKLGEVLMQVSWQLPDAGLVGLAQLHGEGQRERVREVVVSLLRLVLLGAGAVACVVLALNPAFVGLWVGEERFGGLALNALLAALVVTHSVAHGLFAPASTLGRRVQAGYATVLQGALNLAGALVLGRLLGMAGIALAGVLSFLCVGYPAGMRLLGQTTGMSHGELWRRALAPWAARGALLLAAGAGVGWLTPRAPLWVPLVAAPVLGWLYLWRMRPLYAGFPFPSRVRPWLTWMRLVPG